MLVFQPRIPTSANVSNYRFPSDVVQARPVPRNKGLKSTSVLLCRCLKVSPSQYPRKTYLYNYFLGLAALVRGLESPQRPRFMDVVPGKAPL